MTTGKKKYLKKLTKQKYIDFFDDANSIYTEADGVSQPHYIGTAKEFIAVLDELFNYITIKQVEFFNDTNEYSEEYMIKEIVNVFEEPSNYRKLIDDEFINRLNADDIISVFAELTHVNCHVDGFIEKCGKDGVISKLLAKLKDEIL